jgi:hypothetical protein
MPIYNTGSSAVANQTVTVQLRADTGGTDFIYRGGGIFAIHSHAAAATMLTTNGSTTSGAVLHFASTTGVSKGMSLAGTNIATGARVKDFDSTTVTMDKDVTGTVASSTQIFFCPGPIGAPGNWNTPNPPDTYTLPTKNLDGTYGAQHATDGLTYAVQSAAWGLGFGEFFTFVYDGVTHYGVVA